MASSRSPDFSIYSAKEIEGSVQEEVMSHNVVAVDLAKKVFEVAVAGRLAEKPRHRRLSWRQFGRVASEHEARVFVVECCSMAHYWAQRLHTFGHRIRLLPAHQVAPYRERNKTGRVDALALLEAHREPFA